MRAFPVICLLVALAVCNDAAEGTTPTPTPEPTPIPRNKWGWDSYNGTLSMVNHFNLEDMRRSMATVLVGFCDFGCEACKDLVAFLEKAFHYYAQNPRFSINVGLCDVKGEKVLTKKFDIQKLPTIYVFTKLNHYPYEGPMDFRSLDVFIHKAWMPRQRELDQPQFASMLKGCYLCALLVIPDNDLRQIQWFGEAAEHYPDIMLYYINTNKTGPIEGTTGNYTIFLHRDFDDGLKVYGRNESMTIKQISNFFEKYAIRRLLEITPDNIDKILTKEEQSFFLFASREYTPESELFRQLASEKLGLNFAVGHWGDKFVNEFGAFLGVSENDGNVAVLVRFENGFAIKYKPKTLTKEALAKFLDDFKSGTLPQFYKSAPVPATQPNRIKTVVGSNFDELVLNNDSHVFLLVTASYCSHSRRAAEAFKELADRLEGTPDVVFAQMEGTANEHPSFQPKTFPQLKFYRGYDKQAPVDYEGERLVDSMKEFIEKEVNRKLALRDKGAPHSEEL